VAGLSETRVFVVFMDGIGDTRFVVLMGAEDRDSRAMSTEIVTFATLSGLSAMGRR
jgi:hypothetical protein